MHLASDPKDDVLSLHLEPQPPIDEYAQCYPNALQNPPAHSGAQDVCQPMRKKK